MKSRSRIGVVGTGFISRGFVNAFRDESDVEITKVLTRRKIAECGEFPESGILTDSISELVANADLVVECSGDVVHATEVIDLALREQLPVVTMNSEFQVTCGSYFAERGLITEAEGDQPGCLAALDENISQMGFKPCVFGNIKGFLNHYPSIQEMHFWSQKQGISMPKVVSFTDGTKIQIEQALVANGLGATLAKPGMLGIESEDVNTGALVLAQAASRVGQPISDYILSPKSPHGVFIVAEYDGEQRSALQYFKLGAGPYYVLIQNFILCHLEILKTVRRVLKGEAALLNNSSSPTIGVYAVAKKTLAKGERIGKAIGSFEVRGIAEPIAENEESIPIGLLENAIVLEPIEQGQKIRFTDVGIPDSLAKRIASEQ